MAEPIYDVAIVGYGPVGAVLAALLGQAGLTVHVCDRLPGVYEIPRAISLDHEIMRVFQQIGVLAQIEPYFEPFTNSEYYGVDGQLIRRMTMIEPPYPQGHIPSMVFTQPPVEQALRQRMAECPTVTVALQTEMQAIVNAPDMQAKLSELGMSPMPLGGKDFEAFIQGENRKWGPIIKANRITVE